MTRFAWDLHYDDPVQIPGAFYSGEGPRGPRAVPGAYQVKLSVAGKTQTAPLQLIMDPRLPGAEAGAQKQFELSMQVKDRITQLHQAVNEYYGVKGVRFLTLLTVVLIAFSFFVFYRLLSAAASTHIILYSSCPLLLP